MSLEQSGYEVLEHLDSAPTKAGNLQKAEHSWHNFGDEEHAQTHGEAVLFPARVVTSAHISTSAPYTDSAAPRRSAFGYHDDEEAQLWTQDPFSDLASPATNSASINNFSEPPNGGNRQRSRSIISLRSLNDKVSRWTNTLARWTSSSRDLDGETSEIQYSVFMPPRETLSLQHLPKGGFLNMGPVTKSHFDAIVLDAIDALEEGINPQRISSGSSGSYFVFNKRREIVGVFKPKDEEPYGPLSPKWTKWLHRNLFPCFFGRSCLIPNLGYICESAASLLDKQLQSYIVPYTDVVAFSSDAFYYSFWESKPHRPKIGSFQLFLQGYQEADKFLDKYPLPGSLWFPSFHRGEPFRDESNVDMESAAVFQWTPQVIQQFREELEKLVILDYIMRNTDRGLDNWMIQLTWQVGLDGKQVPILKIGAIDSGLAWPWKHPDEWRSYPFGWLFLPATIIGQPFSAKTRKHYLPLLTSTAWWEECTVIFRELFSRDSDFKERMWKKQWAVMKGQAFNVVETLKNPTQGPLELARRTRIQVWDEIMEVPVHVPIAIVSNAMETPLTWKRTSPALNSILEEEAGPETETETETDPLNTTSPAVVTYYAQDSMPSKKVIIERLQMVNSKPPVFTWC